MQVLIYACPNCGRQVEVTEDMLDNTIRCPNEKCRRPFVLEKSVAHMVATRETGDSESLNEELHTATAEDEHTLKSVHPALLRRHPFQALGSGALMVAGIAGAIFFLSASNLPLAIVSGVAALIGGALLGIWYLQMLCTTLTITSRRSMLRRGIVSRRTSEVRHDDVRNLQIDQNFLERLLGVGDLAISSAGQGDVEIRVDGIPDPEGVAEMIRDLQN